MELKALPFDYIHNPVPESIGSSALAFLHQLHGPTVIDIDGMDKSKTVVISTLIHGNEPSGLIALYRILKFGVVPSINVRFIISSVEAAKVRPEFSCRLVDGKHDLNRCFDRFLDTEAHKRAAHILTLIHDVQPIAVLDLHNTSGNNPPFSICLSDNLLEKALASYFTPTMIVTGLRLGSLMEVEFGCPVVTIECGASTDNQAHDVAYNGLMELFTAEQILGGSHNQLVETLRHPLRFEVRDEVTLAYGDKPVDGAAVTLISDIEQHNFGFTRAHCLLGWIDDNGLDNIVVKNEFGAEISTSLFYIENNQIFTSVSIRIFMATTQAHLAKHDCLFYLLVQDLP